MYILFHRLSDDIKYEIQYYFMYHKEKNTDKCNWEMLCIVRHSDFGSVKMKK